MICCPANGKQRWPLVLLLSQDGIRFNKAILLRSGKSDDLPPRRYEGRYKTLGYSYPKAFIHKGNLYISYSTNKEDVECMTVMAQPSARQIGNHMLLHQRETGAIYNHFYLQLLK
jgi:hypothetical protein